MTYRACLLLCQFILLVACACGCQQSKPVARNSVPVTGSPAAAPTSNAIIQLPKRTPITQQTASPSDTPTAAVETQIRLAEVAQAWGIDFRRNDDFRGEHRIIEANGGGAALIDFDCDGRLDLFFTNGCEIPAGLKQLPAPSPELAGLVGWRSIGRTKYEACPWQTLPIPQGYFNGVTTGDFDADGWPDLYVSAYGQGRLLRNNGDGTFADVTSTAGIIAHDWGTSSSLCDVNGDGLPELFVTTYVEYRVDPPVLCPDPNSPDGFMQCSPTQFDAQPDRFYENLGDGTFKECSVACGMTGQDGKGLGVVAFDSNNDQRLDYFVTNDGTPSFLYVQQSPLHGEMVFTEQGVSAGVATSLEGKSTAAMGIACGDADRDGLADLMVINFFLQPNTFFRGLPGGAFEEIGSKNGMANPSRSLLGFGTLFADFQADGWLDAFVANGHVDDWSWRGQEPYQMPPLVMENDGTGHFQNVAPQAGEYTATAWVNRSVASGDLDDDGDVDLVLTHMNDRHRVLENRTPPINPSIWLRLVGTGRSDRCGYGAKVIVQDVEPALVFERYSGGSFQSASSLDLQIPCVNGEQPLRCQVRWPDGTVQEVAPLAAGKYVLVQGRTPYPLTSP